MKEMFLLIQSCCQTIDEGVKYYRNVNVGCYFAFSIQCFFYRQKCHQYFTF